MKSKFVPIDDGASVDKVMQEIEQEAKNASCQANRSKKGSAIAVSVEGDSQAIVNHYVDQRNTNTQNAAQFHIPVNANVDDVAGLLNAFPLLSQMGTSIKVETDSEGNLIVNGKKIPASKLGKGMNMIMVGQERSSENNSSEGGK